MSCYSYVVEQMSDVEAGMKNCLDELSFITSWLSWELVTTGSPGRTGFLVSCFVRLDMQSVNSQEDQSRQLTCAAFTVFI